LNLSGHFGGSSPSFLHCHSHFNNDQQEDEDHNGKDDDGNEHTNVGDGRVNNLSLVTFGSFDVWLDQSPVSSLFKTWLSCKLLLELIEMLLLNWINGFQNVPVNSGSAWWSSYRSSVGPSVLHIEHHHDFSI